MRFVNNIFIGVYWCKYCNNNYCMSKYKAAEMSTLNIIAQSENHSDQSNVFREFRTSVVGYIYTDCNIKKHNPIVMKLKSDCLMPTAFCCLLNNLIKRCSPGCWVHWDTKWAWVTFICFLLGVWQLKNIGFSNSLGFLLYLKQNEMQQKLFLVSRKLSMLNNWRLEYEYTSVCPLEIISYCNKILQSRLHIVIITQFPADK